MQVALAHDHLPRDMEEYGSPYDLSMSGCEAINRKLRLWRKQSSTRGFEFGEGWVTRHSNRVVGILQIIFDLFQWITCINLSSALLEIFSEPFRHVTPIDNSSVWTPEGF